MAESLNQSSEHQSSQPIGGDESALDQRLRAALHDVPLPDGLAVRLKAAVRAASESTRLGADCVSPAVEMPVRESLPDIVPMAAGVEASSDGQPVGGYLRRGALVALFAAAVCGFAWLAHQWRQPAEKSWLVAHCQAIIGRWEEDNPANMELTDSALAQLPEAVRSQLVRLKQLGARDLQALNKDWTGQLLRLDAGDGRAVVLLKLPKLPVVRGLNGRFEVLPTASGGWSLAAMTIGKETYVLAANCTQQQLFQYVRRAAVT